MRAEIQRSMFENREIVTRHFSSGTEAKRKEIEICVTTRIEALSQLFQLGKRVVVGSALYGN